MNNNIPRTGRSDKPAAGVLHIKHLFVAYALLASIMFMGLPRQSGAQNTDNDGALAKAGEQILVKQETDAVTSKMSAGSFSEFRALASGIPSAAAAATDAKGNTTEYGLLNIEFKTPVSREAVFTNQKASRIAGAHVLTVSGRFADVFVASDAAWNAIERNPNVVRVEFGALVNAPPPPDVQPTALISQTPPDSIVRGGYGTLTGKNVVIAVLDTGIDFRHPDFITYDQQGRPTSRIKYLWDTSMAYQKGRGSVAPVRFPNGGSAGTLFTQEQLTAELRSGTVSIPGTDLQGHGTACASIAAGNGNGDKRQGGLNRSEVVGVAPNADIIGITMGFGGGFENVYLINAMAEWLEKAAGAAPLIISGSFGGHYSGHDGQTVMERHLNDRFPLTRPGRAIVFAAGNEGSDAIHSRMTFAKEPKLVSWKASRPTTVRIFMDSNDPQIGIIGTKATPLGNNLSVELNPLTNQYSATIKVAAGIGGIWLSNNSGKSSEAHLYFSDRDLAVFDPQYATYSHLVGSPGNMENALTIGSYSWNDNFHSGGSLITLNGVCRNSSGLTNPLEIGFLSCYSSPGPNRTVTGRAPVMKPEIVAPGEWFSAALAKLPGRGPVTGWRYDSTSNYAAMNGTSSATPYTSGIIALMLEKNPKLTLGEIRTLLIRHASKTELRPFSDALPNNNWGYGKLDMPAVERILGSL